jgi:hypothetical protein
MSKKLAKLLRTEMSASLPAIAKILESKGRNRDKILAHINEDEAELLRMHGGSGTINPETGLMEFYDDGGTTTYFGDTYNAAGQYQPDVTSYTYSPQYQAPAFDVSTYQSPLSDQSFQNLGSQYSYQPLPLDQGFSRQDIAGVSRPSSVEGLGARPQVPTLATPAGVSPELAATGAPSISGEEPGVTDRLAKALGINKDTLAKLGVGGVQALLGARTAKQAAAQGQGAKKELSALAAPYRQRGQELLTAAERGELNPVGQQQLQAMQARLAQGVEQRGGVGVQQAQAQINAYRDQLIQNQYDLGLKVLNIADNIAAGAIKSGLQADQYVNELTSNYMTNIARTLYGVAPQIAQPAA